MKLREAIDMQERMSASGNHPEANNFGTIPNWLLQEEVYKPSKEREGFLQKTILSVLATLTKIRDYKAYNEKNRIAPVLQVIGAVFVILLVSLSGRMGFPAVVLAAVLIRLAFFESKSIRRILRGSIGAMTMSLFILLPSAFLGNTNTWVFLSLKVFISVSLLAILSETIPWNRMTGGLKTLRIPDIIIFTLDITMKYIVLLGEICLSMLQALKVRCIGKNPNKAGALSGVLGITFIKSKEMSEEMYHAMECRGFDGHYKIGKRKADHLADFFYVCALIAVFAVFFGLEVLG